MKKNEIIKRMSIGCLISGLTLYSAIEASAISEELAYKNSSHIAALQKEDSSNEEGQVSEGKAPVKELSCGAKDIEDNDKKSLRALSDEEPAFKDDGQEDAVIDREIEGKFTDGSEEISNFKFNRAGSAENELEESKTNVVINSWKWIEGIYDKDEIDLKLNGTDILYSKINNGEGSYVRYIPDIDASYYSIYYLKKNAEGKYDEKEQFDKLTRCGAYKAVVILNEGHSFDDGKDTIEKEINIVGSKIIKKEDISFVNNDLTESEYSEGQYNLSYTGTTIGELGSNLIYNKEQIWKENYTVKYYRVNDWKSSIEGEQPLNDDEVLSEGRYIARVSLESTGIEQEYNLGTEEEPLTKSDLHIEVGQYFIDWEDNNEQEATSKGNIYNFTYNGSAQYMKPEWDEEQIGILPSVVYYSYENGYGGEKKVIEKENIISKGYYEATIENVESISNSSVKFVINPASIKFGLKVTKQYDGNSKVTDKSEILITDVSYNAGKGPSLKGTELSTGIGEEKLALDYKDLVIKDGDSEAKNVGEGYSIKNSKVDQKEILSGMGQTDINNYDITIKDSTESKIGKALITIELSATKTYDGTSKLKEENFSATKIILNDSETSLISKPLSNGESFDTNIENDKLTLNFSKLDNSDLYSDETNTESDAGDYSLIKKSDKNSITDEDILITGDKASNYAIEIKKISGKVNPAQVNVTWQDKNNMNITFDKDGAYTLKCDGNEYNYISPSLTVSINGEPEKILKESEDYDIEYYESDDKSKAVGETSIINAGKYIAKVKLVNENYEFNMTKDELEQDFYINVRLNVDWKNNNEQDVFMVDGDGKYTFFYDDSPKYIFPIFTIGNRQVTLDKNDYTLQYKQGDFIINDPETIKSKYSYVVSLALTEKAKKFYNLNKGNETDVTSLEGKFEISEQFTLYDGIKVIPIISENDQNSNQTIKKVKTTNEKGKKVTKHVAKKGSEVSINIEGSPGYDFILRDVTSSNNNVAKVKDIRNGSNKVKFGLELKNPGEAKIILKFGAQKRFTVGDVSDEETIQPDEIPCEYITYIEVTEDDIEVEMNTNHKSLEFNNLKDSKEILVNVMHKSEDITDSANIKWELVADEKECVELIPSDDKKRATIKPVSDGKAEVLITAGSIIDGQELEFLHAVDVTVDTNSSTTTNSKTNSQEDIKISLVPKESEMLKDNEIKLKATVEPKDAEIKWKVNGTDGDRRIAKLYISNDDPTEAILMTSKESKKGDVLEVTVAASKEGYNDASDMSKLIVKDELDNEANNDEKGEKNEYEASNSKEKEQISEKCYCNCKEHGCNGNKNDINSCKYACSGTTSIDNYAIKTGDDMRPAGIMSLLVASMAGILGIFKKRKKEN